MLKYSQAVFLRIGTSELVCGILLVATTAAASIHDKIRTVPGDSH